MRIINKNINIAISFPAIIVLLIAVPMVFSISPPGLYYDDAGCLFGGKYFSSHPFFVFDANLPPLLKNVSNLERVFWFYYRPLERILWTLCFLLLGPNTILLSLLQKLLFLITVYLIYKIGHILSNRLSGSIAAVLFVLTPLPYGLLTLHTYLATQFGLVFLLAGFYFTFRAFVTDRTILFYTGVSFAVFSWLCRESNLYIFFGVMSVAVLNYLFFQEKSKSKNIYLLILLAILALSLIFYGYLIIKYPLLYQQAGKTVHRLSFSNYSNNINFYGKEVFNNLNIIFTIFCIYLFVLFRKKIQFIGLVWVGVSLMPLLFSRLVAKTYLFDSFIGIVLFCAAGLSTILRELFNKKELMKLSFYKLNHSFFNNNLLQLLILIFVTTSLFSSSLKNSKEISEMAFIFRTKGIAREERLSHLKDIQSGEAVFVSGDKSKEFYEAILEVFGRKDIKIKVVKTWDEVKELIIGENLLKNTGFEDNFDNWILRGQTGKPNIISIVDDYSFDGNCSLLINALPLNKANFDLINVKQLFHAEPGQTYIFGGWVKLDDFKEGIKFEVEVAGNYKKGFWKTDIMFGDKKWQLLVNTFTAPQDSATFNFYAARSENLIWGKANIDSVFVYKTSKPFLGYD